MAARAKTQNASTDDDDEEDFIPFLSLHFAGCPGKARGAENANTNAATKIQTT